MTKELIEFKTFCNENDTYNVKRILKRNKIDFKFFVEEFYLACCNDNDKIIEFFLLEFKNKNYHINLFSTINMIINNSANASFNVMLKFYKDKMIKYVNSANIINNFCRKMDFEIIIKVINYNPLVKNYNMFAEKIVNYLILNTTNLKHFFSNNPGINKIIMNSNIIELVIELYCNHICNSKTTYQEIIRSYYMYYNSSDEDEDEDNDYIHPDYEIELKYYDYVEFRYINKILYHLLSNYYVSEERKLKYFLTFSYYLDEKLMNTIHKNLQNSSDTYIFYKDNKSNIDDTFILACIYNFDCAKMMKNVFPQIDYERVLRYKSIIEDNVIRWLSNGCCDFSTGIKSARKI